jgi:hypothetical protein
MPVQSFGEPRQRHVVWKTDGWVFDRAVLWKLSSTKGGLKLDFWIHHAVRELQVGVQVADDLAHAPRRGRRRHSGTAVLHLRPVG